MSKFKGLPKGDVRQKLGNAGLWITWVDENDKVAHYFIELIDDSGKKFGFKWTLKKVESSKDFLNCWMTTSVSSPMLLSQSS